jgi:hypothetical protein
VGDRRFFSHCPDEFPRRRLDRDGDGRDSDLIDLLAEFVRTFPAWCEGGKPMNWRVFMYGVQHIGRARAREKLRMADVQAIASAEERDRKRWVREHSITGDV